MRNCHHCQLVWLRLCSIPASPGRWGKLLSCLIAAAWAATLWGAGPGVSHIAGEDTMIALFGQHAAAAWMTMVAVVPIVGMVTDIIALRMLAATLGLTTWTSLLLETIVQDGVFRPTLGSCLVGILACLNADMRLARLVAGRQA